MKGRIHLFFYLLTTVSFLSTGLIAQTGLAADQNPNYMIARDKYMKVADSLNAFHGITVQETYNSIDFLEDRREAREQRRALRRELRLARAQYGNYYGYYNDDYYSPYYNNNRYNNYNYRYNRYGRGWNNDNFYRNTLPLAVTLGSIGWWLCR